MSKTKPTKPKMPDLITAEQSQKYPLASIIVREKEPDYDRAERSRNIDIMSVPIKETSTKEYYLANDRRLKRKLMERGR